ncbi:unnamed protein product [Rotaria sordida]|uniref:Sulfhydryl oxidase n=1 Tax=Rotaria sordida TaxID=392033 RepID=A0A813NQU5_9BILA|nr:unnamed protein product [Rotaria sordida]
MKSLFINKYINILILALIVNCQQALLAALSSGNIVSFYNANDKIVVLTSQNFSSTVYQSKIAWLIEFYASWCGHCQSYANTYREIAIDTWTWKTIIRIAAINCYAGDNNALCRQHSVRGYPALRFIPPETILGNTSKAIEISATDANVVKKRLIKELDNIPKKNKLWPQFTPVNRITLEELYARIPSTVKILLVIAEKRNDFIGRHIMLDFSKYRDQLAIFRTTTDGKLWRKFNVSITDVPALFVILRNRTAQRINIERNSSNNIDNHDLFNNAIRSYIQQTKYIENFDDREFEEIILSKNALKNAEMQQKLVQKKNVTDEILDKNTIYRKVNMVDLELALSYMFREEVPQIKEIYGDAYDALVQWLTVLTKYFPGREPVMGYFKQLLLKVSEHSNGFSGDTFREIINMKTSNAYLPNDHAQYQHCAGSAPQYRGYPCALWLLFHTLTVSQYQIESNQIDVTEVPLAIKNYIKHFFGCRQCSTNFMKETANMTQLNSQNKREAIIYLWKIHNRVNKRLRNQITEDPKHPKLQFPSKKLCPTCQSMNKKNIYNEYIISKTINFLVEYYSKENIDVSLILDKPYNNETLLIRQERLISPIEYHAEIKENVGSHPKDF